MDGTAADIFLSLRERTEVRAIGAAVDPERDIEAGTIGKSTLILTFSLREKELAK
jgi:hypothetical protein